ncbi:MAG: hypothetical protein M9899_02495 [Bdellovibrionaceae bacterium]|nr:hypothetical protein [Pseudobdellovibrionaceae bacterium]
MSNLTDIAIKVRHRTDAKIFYDTHMQIQTLSPQQRFQLGAKFFAICFVAGIVFVLIPILHFVLVPLALIVGIVLFFRGLNTHDYRMETTLKCPQCQKPFTLKAAPQAKWPLKENCPECRAEIVIEKI